MTPFKHLQIIGGSEAQEQTLDVLIGLKPWLQGNAKVGDADENGIIQIWTDQIDQATLGIRRLIYEGCAQYALIHTTRAAETPQNLPYALYTALQVDESPAVDEVVLSTGQSIWVEEPALLGRDMIFLIVQPIYPTRMHLKGTRSEILDTCFDEDEITLDVRRMAHDIRWYRSIVRSNKLDYVCPSCKKGYHERFQLAEHFKKSTDSEVDNERHSKLRMIKRNGDWKTFVQGMEESLGPIQAQTLRDGTACFEEDFLRQISYKAYCDGTQRKDSGYQKHAFGSQVLEGWASVITPERKDKSISRSQASTVRTRCS
ncbi:uncharacterized protein N7483_003760 [Penicillium malachiteum]|uniref:uncharacterized protein n=1 Tax=Penicillium malachiteum TaxID=1324776 RepID=UPI0025477410|nr:uncharacterized protein N7483_003760 [Penicillium malachiteum]KAJ5729252.1 hypothetical protein N7483_003760 [Penicillium malachiteum]